MKYVAFLRGINVGGRIIRMSDLKVCFEKLGLQDVITILQTGNVIFSSEKNTTALKQTIEADLTRTFNYAAHVQVVSLDSLQSILDSYPFANHDAEHHDYVVFFEDGLEQQLATTAAIDTTTEKIKVGSGLMYWRVPKGSTLKSSFAQYLTKAPYKTAHTNRNIRTLQKIVDAA
jgi:uncharacterized protein (DUF1697 family)